MAEDTDGVAPLLALARCNIPTDVQEMLVRGDPVRGIAPGALDLAMAAAGVSTWCRDIGKAPKDGSPLLLRLKSQLPVPSGHDLGRWAGIVFVGRHSGLEPDGFDVGWSFAAPVGHRGFPDAWIGAWRPLPAGRPDGHGESP